MITENTIVIEPFYKAPHMDFRHRKNGKDSNQMSLVDLWIYTILVRYANKDNEAWPSFSRIIDEYCTYWPEDALGNPITTGDPISRLDDKTIRASINCLIANNKIQKVTFANGKGYTYKVVIPEKFEKVNESFLRLNLPAYVKGYLVGFLQNSKDKHTGFAKVWFTYDELSERMGGISVAQLKRAQKFLKEHNLMQTKITQFRNMDGSRSRKEEKTIDLEKLTLKAMYAQVLQNTRDIKELKDGMLTVKDVQGIAEDAIIAKLEELNLLGVQFRKVNPAQ